MDVVNALGRRKSSIARVYVSEGTGKITINKKDLTEYFPSSILQFVVKLSSYWKQLKNTTSRQILPVAVLQVSRRLFASQLHAHS